MDLFGVNIPLPTVVAGAVIIYVVKQLFQDRSLRGIPAVGYTFPILNWFTRIQYIFGARELIREGYTKYQSAGLFRVAALDGWRIIVTSPQLVEELRRAPDDALFVYKAFEQSLQAEYTIGVDLFRKPYHVDVIRGAFTRNLNARFDDIWDEIQSAFGEEIGAEDSWKEVPAVETIRRIVSRVSHRYFVGLPLCRNHEWIRLNIDYTVDVVQGAMLLKITPAPLKLMVSWLLTKIKAQTQLASNLVGSVIAERLKDFEDNGEKRDDRPNDLVTWLIEGCPPELRTVPLLTNRVLLVNFAAIHTSSITFSSVVYWLATNPEWAEPMREEIERVVAAEGWSKLTLTKMHRVDSFIREAQRVDSITMLNTMRWVMKPFMFSNGACVPPGYEITSAAEMLQLDSAHHGERAAAFDPWRWAKIREDESEALKHQMVATEATLLQFGHGKHACPGRFFAANELKGMLAHLVLEYDVRLKGGDSRPPSATFEINIIPPDVQLEFRKRSTHASAA
ncbi:cytochrome P450 [Peniophora sp. CONT]|nr:cytochrome P450 [Peniophora sp. CONT]